MIGGSAGIGLETARRARAEGAEVILTGRNPERLERAAREVGALSTRGLRRHRLRTALERFFEDLPDPIDHVMVTAGRPVLRAAGRDGLRRRRAATSTSTSWLTLARRPQRRRQGAARRHAAVHGRHRRPAPGRRPRRSSRRVTAALPALTANLALELAPVRVNLIAAGFVDTPLSASLLGDQLEARREQLRATLPIGRVVGPADVAALAVHLMTNTALTGATYDIDGGQQLV